mmetsp:Transcript_21789/g.47462  ORF Transcript_21789/g.47462 Transcript_21789/m.47462 type:complete len:301 (+) Transcript_21789:702-1604(+)
MLGTPTQTLHNREVQTLHTQPRRLYNREVQTLPRILYNTELLRTLDIPPEVTWLSQCDAAKRVVVPRRRGRFLHAPKTEVLVGVDWLRSRNKGLSPTACADTLLLSLAVKLVAAAACPQKPLLLHLQQMRRRIRAKPLGRLAFKQLRLENLSREEATEASPQVAHPNPLAVRGPRQFLIEPEVRDWKVPARLHQQPHRALLSRNPTPRSAALGEAPRPKQQHPQSVAHAKVRPALVPLHRRASSRTNKAKANSGLDSKLSSCHNSQKNKKCQNSSLAPTQPSWRSAKVRLKSRQAQRNSI